MVLVASKKWVKSLPSVMNMAICDIDVIYIYIEHIYISHIAIFITLGMIIIWKYVKWRKICGPTLVYPLPSWSKSDSSLGKSIAAPNSKEPTAAGDQPSSTSMISLGGAAKPWAPLGTWCDVEFSSPGMSWMALVPLELVAAWIGTFWGGISALERIVTTVKMAKLGWSQPGPYTHLERVAMFPGHGDSKLLLTLPNNTSLSPSSWLLVVFSPKDLQGWS